MNISMYLIVLKNLHKNMIGRLSERCLLKTKVWAC